MRSYSMYLALKNGYCIGTEPMRMYYAWYMEPYAIQNSRLKALREAMFFFSVVFWFGVFGCQVTSTTLDWDFGVQLGLSTGASITKILSFFFFGGGGGGGTPTTPDTVCEQNGKPLQLCRSFPGVLKVFSL